MPNNPEDASRSEHESSRKNIYVVVLDDSSDNGIFLHIPYLEDEGIFPKHITHCLNIESTLATIKAIRTYDPKTPLVVLLDHNLGPEDRSAKRTGETAFNQIKASYPDVVFGGISTEPQKYLEAGSCLRDIGHYFENLKVFLNQHFPKS